MLKMFLLLAPFSKLLVFEFLVTNLSMLFNVAPSQTAAWVFIHFIPHVLQVFMFWDTSCPVCSWTALTAQTSCLWPCQGTGTGDSNCPKASWVHFCGSTPCSLSISFLISIPITPQKSGIARWEEWETNKSNYEQQTEYHLILKG